MLLEVMAVANPHHVARLEQHRGDIDRAAVDLEVRMHDPLASLQASAGKAGAADDVVNAQLAHDHQTLARVTRQATSLVEIPAELTFPQPIIMLDLLLLAHSLAEGRELLLADVLTRRLLPLFGRPDHG